MDLVPRAPFFLEVKKIYKKNTTCLSFDGVAEMVDDDGDNELGTWGMGGASDC
jgi:hypothetical protein